MILLKILAVVLTVFALLAVFKGPREALRLWKAFGQALGDIIARIVLTVFYFTVLVPFALVARFSQDALGRKAPADGEGFWRAIESARTDLAGARRQF
jgi:hypothetical protein